MFPIAIVDDESSAREELKKCFAFMAKNGGEECKIEEFADASSFFMHFDNQYSIVFLDIEMPDMDGMTAARKLRELDKTVEIIFVTNMAQYATQGYEVNALDYIVKPVNHYAFALKMKRAFARVAKRKDSTILLKTNNGYERLQVSHIYYIEAQGHHVIYHTYYGDFSVYGTLAVEEKRLPSRQFAKCSRSFSVNLRYVESMRDGLCIVGGESLIISRPQKKQFLKSLQDYMTGR